MKIVVVGTGGVGGYFGGLLAHSGQDVTFIARGPHLETISKMGLQVKSVHGDFIVSPSKAVENMAGAGTADVVLVCVKDFHLEQVMPAMEPLVGKDTMVIPLLNGVNAAERLSQEFGRDRVLGGTCSVVAYIEEPGIIRQVSAFQRVAFGEWDGETTPRATALYQAFQTAGADVELSADIRKAMWTKFLFITAYSGVASVVRLPAGAIHACPETMDMIRQAMVEIESIALVKGISLDKDIVDKTISFVEGLAPDATASMQRDVQAGKMFELEAMVGSLVKDGIETGIPTPVHNFLYAALKPMVIQLQSEY